MQLGWRDATVSHASSRWTRLTPAPALYLLVEFGLSSELPSMVDTPEWRCRGTSAQYMRV